jgi:hypothetical protein
VVKYKWVIIFYRGVILMDEMEFQNLLEEMLFLADEADEKIDRITTFNDCGMLTSNKGLVVKMNDGSKFQLTIVKSK